MTSRLGLRFITTFVVGALQMSGRSSIKFGGNKCAHARGQKTTPSAAIVDSQSVKTTEVAQEVGDDGGKLVKGHKRQILVDTLG